jgi:cell wall-associated NlpC family hydrolase
MLIPVEQAIHTPGALLFHFASEPQPGAGEPPVAHVAISLGNGKTIEAANPEDGVNEFNAEGRFEYAAIIPGIGTLPSATPTSLVDLPSGHDSSGLLDLSHVGDGTNSGLDDGLPLTGHFSGSTLGSGSAIGSLIDGDDGTHSGLHGGLNLDFH